MTGIPASSYSNAADRAGAHSSVIKSRVNAVLTADAIRLMRARVLVLSIVVSPPGLAPGRLQPKISPESKGGIRGYRGVCLDHAIANWQNFSRFFCHFRP